VHKDKKDMAKDESKNDTGKLTFEQAIKELTAIVGKIEQGEITLQDSLQQYERGMALIKHCKKILQEAEKRIEKVAEGPQEQQK
jgi:exodeoxyribonuclease VII small subunit